MGIGGKSDSGEAESKSSLVSLESISCNSIPWSETWLHLWGITFNKSRIILFPYRQEYLLLQQDCKRYKKRRTPLVRIRDLKLVLANKIAPK